MMNRKTSGVLDTSRENNFNMIRLIAAVFVFTGHMSVILSAYQPLMGGFPLQEAGVMMLFMISGYLITMSWLSDPNLLRFGVRRFLRLWPPFAVMVLIMTFVAGPLVSELGVQGYFQSEYFVYLRNLFFRITYFQPGVFSNVPVANTTNGSIWTMPIEALFYVLTPILLTLLRVKGHSRHSFHGMAVLTGAAVIFDFCLRLSGVEKVIFIGTDWVSVCHLLIPYLIGMLFTYEEVRKYLNLQVGCALMSLLLIFQVLYAPLQYLMMYLIFPYFVFSFAFAPTAVFKNFGKKTDLSYGIYLYGFFFQQLITSLQLRYGFSLGEVLTFLISLLLTAAAAWLSWHLVEKPVQKFSRRLIRRLKSVNGKI